MLTLLKPFLNIYDKHYKRLLLIPFALLVAAFILLGIQYATTGSLINKDVSLSGGVTITALSSEEVDLASLENGLSSAFAQTQFTARSLRRAGDQIGFVVTSTIDATSSETVDAIIGKMSDITGIALSEDDYAVEFIGPSLGESFFKETALALFIAFADMVVTLAITNLLGIQIGTAGIAAFLMLIGYSVDTDILLSTRVLKRKEGTVLERILGACRTGLIMTITSIAAVSIALIFAESLVVKQIMSILLIGLTVDIIYTWIQNAGIIRWYVEKKEGNR